MKSNVPNFWKWFFFGNLFPHEKAGIKNYFDFWLIIHLIISSFLTYLFYNKEINMIVILFIEISSCIIISIWGSKALFLLNTKQIIKLTEFSKNSIISYTFKLQSSILSLFISIILWTIFYLNILQNNIILFIAFFSTSILIRECWQNILLSNMLTIYRSKIILNK